MLDWRPSALLQQLNAGQGKLDPLYLIDVGASGGLHSVWAQWGDALHALGIDALVREVERLRAIETRPHVAYAEAMVISGKPAEQTLSSNYILHRSASYLGTVLKQIGAERAAAMSQDERMQLWARVVRGDFAPPPNEANYANVPDRQNDPFYSHYARLFEQSLGLTDVAVTSRRATLDELAGDVALPEIDLIKIDTDGYDLDVLRGADRTLERTLLVEIECQFHGPTGPNANVFGNIDTYLRERGFTLLKLAPLSYSRSALPAPFVYPELPAQTVRGPIQWADALYGRDLAAPDCPERYRSPRQVRTMACILELYELADVSAELLLRFPEAFEGGSTELLDALSAKFFGEGVKYTDVWDRFAAGVASYR